MTDLKFTNKQILFITIGLTGWLMEIIRLGYYLKSKIEKLWNINEKVDLIINNQKETHSLAEITEIIEEMKQKKLNEKDIIDKLF